MLPKVPPSGNVRGSSLKSPMIDFTFRAVVFSGRPLFVFKNNESNHRGLYDNISNIIGLSDL